MLRQEVLNRPINKLTRKDWEELLLAGCVDVLASLSLDADDLTNYDFYIVNNGVSMHLLHKTLNDAKYDCAWAAIGDNIYALQREVEKAGIIMLYTNGCDKTSLDEITVQDLLNFIEEECK